MIRKKRSKEFADLILKPPSLPITVSCRDLVAARWNGKLHTNKFSNKYQATTSSGWICHGQGIIIPITSSKYYISQIFLHIKHQSVVLNGQPSS